MTNKRLGMVIDTHRCQGCHACELACKQENNVPVGNWWNRLVVDGGATMDTPDGEFPNLSMSYLTIACQHCANPACVEVCPTGATWKDEATGVVHQDHDVCIGCGSCISACPILRGWK